MFEKTAGWTDASTAATVTVNNVTGKTPTTNPPANPNVGDVFVNTADRSEYIYVALDPDKLPTPGPNWVQAAGDVPLVVSLSNSTGQNPTTNPPTLPPNVGDWWINEVDGTMWLYAIGGGAAVPPATGWQPMTPSSGNVYISDVASVVPSTPGTGETLFTFPLGTRLSEGDRFGNRVDHGNYVYAPDPAKANAFVWVKLPADNAATLSITPDEGPVSPAPPGGSTYAFTRPPKVGDIFLNLTSGTATALLP